MSVTVSLKNIDKRQKFLQSEVDSALLYVSSILHGKIIKAWLSGKAPDGSAFKKGSSKYLKWKSGTAKKANRINLNLSGNMQEGFTYKNDGKNKALLYFQQNEKEKAQWNYNIRKNMLKLGKKLHKLITDKFMKRMTK